MPSQNYGRGMAARDGVLLCNGKVDRGVNILARDLIFALLTERGSLPADPEKGLGLSSMLMAATDPAELPAIGPDIEAELLKDPRVSEVDATVGIQGAELSIQIVVTPNAGPTFSLIGPLSAIRTEIIAQ